MNKPTPEQIKKLPQWAQAHIEELQRQRDDSVAAMARMQGEQKVTPFFTDDHVCDGEQPGPRHLRRYFNAHHVCIEHAGVRVRVSLEQRGVSVQYGTGPWGHRVAVMQPTSYQQVLLTTVEDAR